jgi:hypothetical protein
MCDIFYTKIDVANNCANFIKNNIPSIINFNKDIIIEPSAGNGAFIKGIENLARMSIFFDQNPQDKRICERNYLTFDFERMDRTDLSGLWYDDVHVVGCPPFGEAPAYDMAVEFIKISCTYAKSISFILPQGLDYTFPAEYYCVFKTDLPPNSFNKIVPAAGAEDKKVIDYDIAATFQIWVKR